MPTTEWLNKYEAIKDKLLDAFSTMKDKPVNVELKIKYI